MQDVQHRRMKGTSLPPPPMMTSELTKKALAPMPRQWKGENSAQFVPCM